MKNYIAENLNTFTKFVLACLLAASAGGSAVRAQALDPAFQGNIQDGAAVRASAVQADGKILIAGAFTFINNSAKNNILRLNADGSLDASFNTGTGPNSTVNSVVVQPDGKILIGGSFLSYNGSARNKIARLNTDGSPDLFNACTAGPNADVSSIALQSDRVLGGGYLTTFNGVWYGLSSANGAVSYSSFGLSTDTSIAAAYQ